MTHEDVYRRALTLAPEAIRTWQECQISLVMHVVYFVLRDRGMTENTTLYDEAYGDALLAVVEKSRFILSRRLSNKACETYTTRVIKNAVAQSITKFLTTAGFGPALRTRQMRLAKGQPAYKPFDPRALRLADDDTDPDGGIILEELPDEDQWFIERRKQFLAWVASLAEQLADDQLRAALALAVDPDCCFGRHGGGAPNLSAIARRLNLPRRTLHDRLRALGERIASVDPNRGVEFLGKIWEAAAKNGRVRLEGAGREHVAA